ncbi:hypothetical protein GJ496_010871 [Pomphorhynchus laevis]|nr:hypothetical protein GJ496_010871 [Pomphorhynchus laevis]
MPTGSTFFAKPNSAIQIARNIYKALEIRKLQSAQRFINLCFENNYASNKFNERWILKFLDVRAIVSDHDQIPLYRQHYNYQFQICVDNIIKHCNIDTIKFNKIKQHCEEKIVHKSKGKRPIYFWNDHTLSNDVVKLFSNILHNFDFNLSNNTVSEKSPVSLIRYSSNEYNRTMVDFGSPNIGKPLHPGHLRALVHGSFIVNILSEWPSKHDVQSVCYFGDCGRQVALLLAGLMYQHDENIDEVNINKNENRQNICCFENIDMKSLLNVYVKLCADSIGYARKVDEITQALDILCMSPNKDKSAMHLISKLWNLIRDLTEHYCHEIFDKINIKFDYFQWESEYVQEAHSLISQLVSSGYARKLDDGSVQFTHATDIPFTISSALDTTLYISRDLACLACRLNNNENTRLLYIADTSQTQHFKRLATLAKTLPILPNAQLLHWTPDAYFHVPFGRLYNLKTRNRPCYLLSDVFNCARKAAKEGRDNITIKQREDGSGPKDMDKIFEVLGITNLIINDTIRPRLMHYKFELDEVITKASVAYKIQYCHARLASIYSANLGNCLLSTKSIQQLDHPSEIRIIEHLLNLPNVLDQCESFLEACYLTRYIIELCKLTNKCIKTQRIKNAESADKANARFTLFHICRLVISDSLSLLGIEALDYV